MKKIGWLTFLLATGHFPKQDDLERANCQEGGCIGHYHCGWSEKHNKPMFMLMSEQINEERRGHLQF